MKPDAPVHGPEPDGGILDLPTLDMESLRDLPRSALGEALRRAVVRRDDDTAFVLHQRNMP
jgi:hypothetical protein